MATQITALPTPPSRNSAPDTFSDEADAFLGALPVFRTEINTVAVEAEADALTASNAATTATTQAGIATTGANTATTQAGIATTQAGIATTGANTATTKATEFKAAYLGSFATDQTLDGNGNPVVAGALYFNTTIDLMRVYNGATWQDASSSVNGTANRYDYTATAAQTTFSATYDIGYVDVYFNGIRLIAGDDYTANNGTTVVLTTPADAGDSVYIIGFGNFLFSKAIPNEVGNGDKVLTTDGLGTPTLSWTDRLKMQDGTLALPSYSFKASASTGMYSHAANALSLVTNGVSRLSISSSGLSTLTGLFGINGTNNGTPSVQIWQASYSQGLEIMAATSGANNGVVTMQMRNSANTITRLGFYGNSDTTSSILAPNTLNIDAVALNNLKVNGVDRVVANTVGVGINKTPAAALDYRDTINAISTNVTAVASNTYVLLASLTLTLPASPVAGDWVKISNRSATVTCVIGRNAQNIMGLAENMTVDNLNAGFTLVFADATRGWIVV